MAKINLGDLNVTNARKVAKEAGLKGFSKADLPTIIVELEKLDETALLSAYAAIMEEPKPTGEGSNNAGTENTHEPTLIAVFPACPACGANDVPEPGDDGVTICSCNQELLVGTHEACQAELSCIGMPANDAICPNCQQPMIQESSDEAQSGEIILKLDNDTIVYSDPTAGIAGRISFELAREKAKLGKGSDWLSPDEFGMELSCQNPTCRHQKGEYNVSAAFLLDQLERATENKPFRAISPWHPGHADCREVMLASDVPCPLGCGNMLDHKGAEIATTGKLVICSSCRTKIEGLKVTTVSTKSGEEVVLPAWSFLAENFYDNQILTREELAEAKSEGYEPSYEGPGELSVEVIETINELLNNGAEAYDDTEEDDNSPSNVKCPRCSKHKLTIAQAHKLADGNRVVCVQCAKELQGPKEPVSCALCNKTVLLSPLQRYLIGDENVRCSEHKGTEIRVETQTETAEDISQDTSDETPAVMPEVQTHVPREFEDAPASPAPVQAIQPEVSVAPVAPPVASSGSDIASAIVAMAEVLKAMPQQQNMAQIMQAIPAQPDLAAILQAVVQPQPNLAELIAASKQSSGTEETLVEQLGTIVSDLMRSRMTPEDVASTVRAAVYGDLNGDHVPGADRARQGSRPLSVEEPTLDD